VIDKPLNCRRAAVVRNVARERAAFDVQCADVGDSAPDHCPLSCSGIIAIKEAVIHGQRSAVVQDRCAFARQRRLPVVLFAKTM